MKAFLSGIIFLLFLPSYGQNNTIDMPVGVKAMVDSLEMALKNTQHDTMRCNIINTLIETMYPAKGWLQYNEQLLKIAGDKLKITEPSTAEYKFYQKHYAGALNNSGFVANLHGDIQKALEYHGRCLKIQEEIGNKQGIATSLINIAGVYDNQGDIPKALDYLGRSLKIQEEIGDKNGIAYSLNNIGGIYNNQHDIQKALEYYDRSLKIREEIGDEKGIAMTLNNIGNIYQSQNDIPKALNYAMKSLKIREEIGDKHGVSNSLNSIASIYFTQGDNQKALDYSCKSLSIREEIGDKKGIAMSLKNIGNIYYKLASASQSSVERQKNYAKALEYSLKSMKVSRELGYPENIRNAAEHLNKIYKATGNYKLALENYDLFILMRDSIANEANKKASIKSQLKYEYEKKATADSVKIAEEKKVVQAQLKQEQTQRYALYGGLGLIGVFAIFMVNRFRVTNKQKKLIEEQKKIVESQKYIVEIKQKEILDSIRYAKRIQSALVTSEYYITKELKRLIEKK